MQLQDLLGILDEEIGERDIEEIKKIVTELKKYDIDDFLKRLCGLNVVLENQNKSILFDALIAEILLEKREAFLSKIKISSGKFNKIVRKLERLGISVYIDPNENVFVQNVVLDDNYTVYNGIDYSSAYNIQLLLDVMFFFVNDFPEKLNETIRQLMSMVLTVSDEVAKFTNIQLNSISSAENELKIPDNKTVLFNSNILCYDEKKILALLGNNTVLFEEILSDFDTELRGTINLRPFYKRPFLRMSEDNRILILNISVLPVFAFNKALEIASDFNVLDKVISRYNEYNRINCVKDLENLGHYKIKEKDYGFNLLKNDYYQEMIASVNNSRLMLVIFLFDDAFQFNELGLKSNYPDNRHSNIIDVRMKYYNRLLDELNISKDDFYVMIIPSNIGRIYNVGFNSIPSNNRFIYLYPFSLRCIKINENKESRFLYRYSRAKNKQKSSNSSLWDEMNLISFYVQNRYTFYFSDDYNGGGFELLLEPGESLEYIQKALLKQRMMVIDSYTRGWKTKIIALDNFRNIFIEDNLFNEIRKSLCVTYSNCIIWVTTDNFEIEVENLSNSLLDLITYWLSECKEIIEKMKLKNEVFHFDIVLENVGDINSEKLSFDKKNDEIIRLDYSSSEEVKVIFDLSSIKKFWIEDNKEEMKVVDIILNYLNEKAEFAIDYTVELTKVFGNKFKKKMLYIDVLDNPIYMPLLNNNRTVSQQDIDFLLDVVGDSILRTRKWNFGVVPDCERNKVTNYAVNVLFNLLQDEIGKYSADGLIQIVYRDLEETIHKLFTVPERFVYDVTCYPESEQEMLEKYNELNQTSLALKFLIEYISACPPSGEKIFDEGDYEFILAICFSIIDWAYKSDLFNYNIFNTPVEILQSGRIGLKHHEFIEMSTLSEKHRQNKLNKVSLKLNDKYIINNRDYSDELNTAFIAEFGYSFKEFWKVIFSMISVSRDIDHSEVYKIDRNELIEKIRKLNSSYNVNIIDKIIDDISLNERNNFLDPPEGFRREDIYPWRFNRQYSFMRRPLICIKNEVLWGNRQLYHMIKYTKELIFEGKLVARSKQMKTLMGYIVNENGAIFNDLIAEKISTMGVFRVEKNVKKVNRRNIADDSGNTLGDIDLLLIDDLFRKIYIVEVKRFAFARNPYEISQEYKKMFEDLPKRGFVTKHSRRVDWVKKNMRELVAEYGLAHDTWDVVGLFIVNEPIISNSIYQHNIEIISKDELSIERIRST